MSLSCTRVRALTLLSDGVRTPETKATGTCRCAQREPPLRVVAHHVLNVLSKAYDMRRSPSPALAEDTQITVRRQQNARQTSVGLVFACSSHNLMIHFAVVSHAIADERLLQPRYHIRAERNSSVVEYV